MKATRIARARARSAGGTAPPLMTLRSAFGPALLTACTAVAMVQSRLVAELGFRVVALPTVRAVREGRRTLAVAEWALYPEGDALPAPEATSKVAAKAPAKAATKAAPNEAAKETPKMPESAPKAQVGAEDSSEAAANAQEVGA